MSIAPWAPHPPREHRPRAVPPLAPANPDFSPEAAEDEFGAYDLGFRVPKTLNPLHLGFRLLRSRTWDAAFRAQRLESRV